ncbi:hypothetical protein DHEL01_v206464 [Diaporthe helianthi]|uniref:Uncharacterized protein n=1 Tax=Diaporthe helianthi TaxID=158607 RepID=A0A2P5HY41_DIAHE|nr:hypothetical protein DHEL01_v206464 [Diaporthe helianthi]
MFDSLHLLRQLCGKRKKDSTNNNIIDQGLNDAPMAPAVNTTTIPSRHQAYDVLYCAGIPSLIWGEDALEHLGVPTHTFCLYLMVPDHLLPQAIDHLMRAGYQKRQPPSELADIRQFSNIYSPPNPTPSQNTDDRFGNPDLDPEDSIDSSYPPVILLPAGEWYISLPETSTGIHDCYPTLPQMLISIISKWLVLEEQDSTLRLRLGVFIEYIYDYLDAVKQPGFEETLPQRLRLFHSKRLISLETDELGTYAYQKRLLEEMEASADGSSA